jgi:predicted ATP-grasp superfamily ATP-dependent carboligase
MVSMSLYDLHSRPELRDPVLVMAPEGWIDAGLGGVAAVAAVLEAVPTDIVATFDVDGLLDHRSRRPIAHIVDGVYQGIDWPGIHLRAGQDSNGQGILVLTGPEPDYRWRAYSDAVGELAQMFGVRLFVGMGAFPAPFPHTRTQQLAATAASAELANKVGVVPGPVDVPAGILVVIQRRFEELGIPAIGLWARVPHYAATMPYPDASVLLLEGLASIAGVDIDASPLREAGEQVRQRLDQLAANSPQHQAVIRQLEAQVDAKGDGGDGQPMSSPWGDLPTGDELAAEVERFLRDQPPE